MSVLDHASRIAILGYSGSGKSTLATRLALSRSLPSIYLDQVHWLPGWVERDSQEAASIVNDFLNLHDAWVIEGNYQGMAFERRLEDADAIVILDVNRLTCLYRAIRRWLSYRNTSRPDMTAGCPEKLDAEFLIWLMWKGRSHERAQRYRAISKQYREKCVIYSKDAEFRHELISAF
ncbi:MAG: hypothetical protein LKI98_02620 [Bifidobacterium crudilactis]|nr:hypothetical protein [Bifidobacterium crudilactis]MCI1889312.1 hypothetical protein [Bifidobacterium crudilactis]